MAGRRRRRLGLRARVTFIYALGALLLSSMVAVGTFAIARARLVSEAEQAAQTNTFRNAIDLRQRLQAIPPEQLRTDAPSLDLPGSLVESASAQTTTTTTPVESSTTTRLVVDLEDVLEAITRGSTSIDGAQPSANDPTVGVEGADQILTEGEPPVVDAVSAILENLFTQGGVRSLLVIDGAERSLTGLRAAQLPADLKVLVEAGSPARQRLVLSGEPQIAVGTPIIGLDAEYYEITSLADLNSTLNSLQTILAGTALAAIIAGAALGSYSARRALAPLSNVSAAAQSIALGQFDTRLESQSDPDLAGLTSSFNDMVDALQARVERDGRFATDVSHELRSPLMTLAASVGVLQGRRDDLPPSAQKAVDLLSQDVERFEGLVEDLLEISRIDVGAVELDRTPIFLDEFLRFVVAQSRTPDVPVDHRPEDAGLVITADKRRLAQALTNLLDNAVKYAGAPSSVSFRKMGDRVNIYVDDLGPGVRPEDRTRIFDRFTRAGSDAGRRGQVGGVGLGLSLVSEHLRLHDGNVSVTDRPDGRSGARFVVDLPIGEHVEFDEEMAT